MIRGSSSSYVGKRAFDLCAIVVSAPIWIPLLAVLAALVRLIMGAPVLFRQRRIGAYERPFELLKLRTMTNARDAGGALLPDAARFTRFGRLLRSTSLDELPELLNVLRGEMSLVGPRPLLPEYLPLYSAEHRRRHAVRPGLTGLAQISGRNALTWPDRFDLDVEYVNSNSLRMDVRILRRTVSAVVSGTGVEANDQVTMPAFVGYQDER